MQFAAFGLICLACLVCRLYGQPPQNLVIITDMEPDDRIALAMVAASELAQRVLAIGTTVLNAERKAALARHALQETALAGVAVYAGTGGTANDYPEMKSTKAAREYGDQEGKDILEQDVLDNALLNRDDGNSELARAIGHVHLMGGWNEIKGRTRSSTILRSSYNVNMDGRASAQLLKMASEGDVQVTLYSSHVIAKHGLGSINGKRFPRLIEMIKESQAPCIQAFRTAGLHWDLNLFTPADPLTVLGLLTPELIKATESVQVEVIIPDEGQMPSEDGYEILMRADTSSGITLEYAALATPTKDQRRTGRQ
uniref:Inosine/uridine-preferring nucleoside hydrolase domain-containing protein n=1 Tax=Globodera rostochiensis TaxID=31243 RepID=A0A914H846_GLORO